jgi:hypothetical protein
MNGSVGLAVGALSDADLVDLLFDFLFVLELLPVFLEAFK